ncbi:DUF3801 domain-containing protein [Enterococcus faecalis]|nr:DUF3801 domain-containing protein [Enterococcus faecalis]
MEQREVIHKYYVVGTNTLDKMLKVMADLSANGLNQFLDNASPLKGEVNLYKLMSRSEPVTSAFLNQKVDLNKLKDYLQDQGLPFAFKETKEGTNLYFRVKDNELAKKALENAIKDLYKNPKKILRKPESMTFEEKLAYVQKDSMYKGSISRSKTPKKGRSL